jgi:hypothetical protein
VKKKETPSQRVQHARARGSSAEYRLAKLVHGVRVGAKTIVKLPDVVNELFAFESKWTRDFPVYLREKLSQCKTNTPEGFIGVLVTRDSQTGEVYYTMAEKDWLNLLNGDK